MTEGDYNRSNRWLTVLMITPEVFGMDQEQVRLALEKENIEFRPLWPPARRAYASERNPCIFSRYLEGNHPLSRNQQPAGKYIPPEPSAAKSPKTSSAEASASPPAPP